VNTEFNNHIEKVTANREMITFLKEQQKLIGKEELTTEVNERIEQIYDSYSEKI
jgi:uncharacterized protein YlzI (FlbEa/FlbD family)